MSKQLRIWLFVLLGTLLTSTSLLAEGVITMTTNKGVGEEISLSIEANGNVTIEGVEETPQTGDGVSYYTLTSQTVTIRGDVTELDCSGNQLTNLNVSECISLTKLNSSRNELTSLDVSSCISMAKLNCGINQLTSLDASGCTSLTKLECHNNQLTSLNASGCTSLTELSCSYNQLTSLDASGCTSLTKLECQDNQLTSLDASGCTALKALSIAYQNLSTLSLSGCTSLTELECHNNQLTSLDVSSCTALTSLDCSKNQLTSLELSNCTALKELDCSGDYSTKTLTSLNVSGCSVLTTLSCSYNLLIGLDLLSCSSLTKLDCQKNQLTSLDLSSCRALIKVDCSSNQLTSLDLSDHKDLTTLSCSDNLLRKIDLSNCPSIVSLTCDINQIKESEMTNLVNSLPDLQGKEVGYFRVFNETSEHEGNVCLSDHVATAKAKNWKTQFKRDYYGDIWYDYTGADKPTFAVTNESTRGGIVAITGASNLNSVVKGTELTVVATPAEGYELTALTANGVDILATKRFVVTEATVVKATFELITYSVKTSKLGEGTLNVSGADNLDAVMPDTELTIEATPAEGYELTALTANDEDILTSKKVVVNEDLIITATFEKKTFAVTLTSNEHGDITIVEPVDLEAVPYGTTLTVKATGKNAQCVLTELTANGEDILSTQSFVVTNVTEVKATFVDHTGVETTVTQQTQLYPNPATDYVIVEGVAPASEVTLHSMTGERLYAGRADDRGTLQIDLTPYADGVYLVCVAGETYRVVVRH